MARPDKIYGCEVSWEYGGYSSVGKVESQRFPTNSIHTVATVQLGSDPLVVIGGYTQQGVSITASLTPEEARRHIDHVEKAILVAEKMKEIRDDK